MPRALFTSDLNHLKRISHGKVRDLYALGADYLLIIATDRLSAFDVVLSQPIPGKGEILTRISNFWFKRTRQIVANHLVPVDLSDAIPDPDQCAELRERTTIVKRLKPLPIEAVVRGYLIGSGWKDYQETGAVCGISLPPGLRQADPLQKPLFTPATKACRGNHDENITFDQAADLIGGPLAEQIRGISIRIYQESSDYARQRGVIIADTKLEFGLDEAGMLYLIDEVLTPDSSRFWPLDTYRPDMSPPSFDKQFVRDYLETLDWNKKAPGPRLPEDLILKTAEKYREAERRLMWTADSVMA